MITKRDLALLEENYGVDFSEASLLLRVSIANLILNSPNESQMNKITASLKNNKTFHAFLTKIFQGNNNG